jgi:phage protein D
MGSYTIDEVESSGMPRTLKFSGKAVDMKADFKSQKKRSWDNTTLGDLVATIAAEHDMQAKMAKQFVDIKIDHLDQSYESDMNLLTRLAKQYGAMVKPASGYILFVKNGAGVKADGQPLPTTAIALTDATKWQVSVTGRQFFARVGASWRDKRKAATVYAYAGSGDPVMYLQHPYPSDAEALAAATAKLGQLLRGKASLSMTLDGKPVICAEMPIMVSVGDPQADGEWIVTNAKHQFDGNGLVTTLEAQRREDFDVEDDSSQSGGSGGKGGSGDGSDKDGEGGKDGKKE